MSVARQAALLKLAALLRLAALLFAAPVALTVAAPAAAQQVRVAQGLAAGITHADGVREWRGLPFAAPPVGDLRWRAPAPAAPWSGVYHADRYAPQCMQPLRAPSINHYFGAEATSEDCLYLNVWAPPLGSLGALGSLRAARARLPVVVWIYGGGFTIGSPSMPNYAGSALARRGVIQVNIAYRVGALGFLAHPELTREGGGASGNYGLMDQIAALHWVQANAAAFGGDPANVTIMGQSAGSMSTSLLQASPQARGLFQRIVAMSGAMFGDVIRTVPLSVGEAQGSALQAALGAGSLGAMRGMAADRIIAAPTPRVPIVIDGRVLTATPAATFAAHGQADVPLMLGFTRDEAFRALGPVATPGDFAAAVRRTFPAHADAILAAYPVGDAARVARAVADVQRDSSVGVQMAQWARAQAAHGSAPVYGWLFSRVHPYAPGVSFSDHDPATVGAYHSGDIPYWLGTFDAFNSLRVTRNWGATDQRLSAYMLDAISHFARGDAPAADWPRFDASAPQLMGLGDTIGVLAWPNYAALDLFADAAPPAPPAAPPAAPAAPVAPERPRARD